MSAVERQHVIDTLPNEVTDAEMSPPEGDLHFRGKVDPLETLRSHFRRKDRKVYLASELPVYYPDEPRFAPDLLAVVDVEDKMRGKWLVSAEGRGLDVVLEVHVGGPRRKDAIDNVKRYARLEIPEYFIFDRNVAELSAYRFSAKSKGYLPIVPQHGRYRCERLGLDLQIQEDRLRFYDGNAMLLEASELVSKLENMVADLQRHREEDARRLADETRHREEETRRREEAERELAELRDKLKNW
jgi:Uma2 family endonuclease